MITVDIYSVYPIRSPAPNRKHVPIFNSPWQNQFLQFKLNWVTLPGVSIPKIIWHQPFLTTWNVMQRSFDTSPFLQHEMLCMICIHKIKEWNNTLAVSHYLCNQDTCLIRTFQDRHLGVLIRQVVLYIFYFSMAPTIFFDEICLH